jgi:hypothetical protein
MKQIYQVSSLTRSLLNLTRCLLRRLGLAGSGALIATSLALLILPSARAQSIEPLYGNLDNFLALGPSNTPALAPLNLAALPGWFVSAACAYVDGNEVLRITVWQDTGKALNLMGSDNYTLPTSNPAGSPAKCGNASVVSMFNTSAAGDTTIVAATVDFAHAKPQLTAFQVGPTGSVTPIGTPAIPDGGQSADWITITRMSQSIVLIEYDAVNPSMPYSPQQYLVVDSFEVPASGDIAELSHIEPQPNSAVYATGLGDITRVNDKQAVAAVVQEAYLEGGMLQYGNLLMAFNVDDKGTVTQEGYNGAYPLGGAGDYAVAPSIAEYFLGSNPSVITAQLDSKGDLALATFSLNSSGELTAELTLTWDPVSGSAPFPSIFFIPDDNLPVVAEYGGNGRFDMNVFDQNSSGLYELTSYHSDWKYEFNATPQGVTAIGNHRVATALWYDLPACKNGVGLDHNCAYALEVWEFKPKK